jgi:flagellar biosynthesis chaperone FliJ
MLETAQREHNRIETMYETATRKRDHAQTRVKEARDQYRAAVEELHQLNTSQEYLEQCTEYNELSKTVSDKRRDNELVHEFNSVVNMQ